ncbi:MAG: M67 family metallopeptidase [Synergistaceae bacterium]|jgi:proteasome lid subunit RPN8/RPN11|nr:M67 family metallopeptidase [Synergistaceae bacterium]
MIFLDDAVNRAIRNEAEASYPNECCGILLGTVDPDGARSVTEIIEIDNTSDADEQYHRFTIGPDDFMRAEIEARRRGVDVLGFYHSHPDHPAMPSDYDLKHAMPCYSYVIVAVESGKSAALTSWEMTPDRARFIQELQR